MRCCISHIFPSLPGGHSTQRLLMVRSKCLKKLPSVAMMNLLQIYGYVFASFFTLLLFLRSIPLLASSFRFIPLFIFKHITHRLVLRRHRFAGPWTYADVLTQLTVNLFLVGFQATLVEKAGRAT
jgi:hypothetical protein